MVQHAIESKFSEYGLPHTDTGRPIYDKNMSLQMTAKKTVLRDLQNENTNIMPKSSESNAFLKESEPGVEPVKVSSPKRTEPVHLVNQSKSISAANGHLVYVRRKAETESLKSNIHASASSKDNSFCSPPRKVGEQYQTTVERVQAKESPICVPEIEPIPNSSLTCTPSERPSIPSSCGKSPNNLQTIDSNALALSLSINPSDRTKRMNNQYWEERYCQLQDLLEMLDRLKQDNYVQMLRSLSAEGLSLQAIELEKRSIQLSLEEAREFQRVRQLNVLGKHANHSRGPAAQLG